MECHYSRSFNLIFQNVFLMLNGFNGITVYIIIIIMIMNRIWLLSK